MWAPDEQDKPGAAASNFIINYGEGDLPMHALIFREGCEQFFLLSLALIIVTASFQFAAPIPRLEIKRGNVSFCFLVSSQALAKCISWHKAERNIASCILKQNVPQISIMLSKQGPQRFFYQWKGGWKCIFPPAMNIIYVANRTYE